MKHFDIYTIVCISAVGTFAIGLALLTASRVYFGKVRGMAFWATATLLQAFGWIGLLLRDEISEFLSIIVSNGLIVLSVSIYLNVIARFKNNTTHWWWFYLPTVLAIVMLTYYTYVDPDLVIRRVIIAFASGIMMFYCSYLLLADKHRPSTHVFTGSVFALTTIVLFARGIIMTYHHSSQENLFTPSLMQDISYLVFYITTLMYTFGFVLMCNDFYIYESKKNAALLMKSEEQYRSIVENAQEGIWLGDENYTTVFVNKKMADMLHYTIDEMVGKSAFFFMDPSDFENAHYVMGRRRQGISDVHEFRFKTKEGEFRLFSLNSSPILLEDGQFNGVLVMMIDITDQYAAAEKLKSSEQRLKEAQKIARIGDYHYNFKTGIWKCSHVVDEISGLNKEEIQHIENWTARFAPEFREAYMKDLTDTIVNGIDRFTNYRDYKIIQAHTGLEKWIALTGEMRRDENGQPIEIIGTVQDITDRKKEEELIRTNTELRNLSGHLQAVREEERKHIAREIHDELGQQLTAIKIEVARWNNRIKKEAPEIKTEAGGLIEMVNHGISTVRKIATELRGGLLNELGLETAIESHSTQFHKSTGIKTNLDIDLEKDNFPEPVVTNVFRIYQEALTNVARHSGASQVNTRLFIRDSVLTLSVSDNGCGITEDAKSKATLGITGMKERASMLNGKISFRNLSPGTNVTLKIPLS